MKNKILTEGFPFSEGILSGKTAVVCGASEGIGRATALLLARSGARVITLARNQSRLEELITEMHGTGHKTLSIDLEDTKAVEGAVAVLRAEQASILINNAGGPPGSPLMENSIGDFEAPFKRHLHASHLLVQGLAPVMEQMEFGRIVNVISTSVREPIEGIGLSNTLRGAMASWSKSLSRELHPCIAINNVLPGYTDTERLVSLSKARSLRTGQSVDQIYENWKGQAPINRLVDPFETASAIVWLCLPVSGAIRGVSLAVDGGRMRSI